MVYGTAAAGALRVATLQTLCLLVGCGTGPPSSICSATEQSDLRSLCALDKALEQTGEAAASPAACKAIEEPHWQYACVMQLAEQQSWQGNLARAYATCQDSGILTRACVSQVAWQGIDRRRVATPSSKDAQQQVDRFVEGMPKGDVTAALRGFQGADDRARASAWFSIYAGSGSTDPTALQSATTADASMARSAFAWEAVRLLPSELTMEETIRTVQNMASGDAPPIRGAPSNPNCPHYDVMPRLMDDFRLQPFVRAFGSWQRFTDTDANTDLRVATLDALLLQHGRFEGLSGLDDASEAVQKTIARHIALLAPATCNSKAKDSVLDPACADLIEAVSSKQTDGVRFTAGVIRKALQQQHNPMKYEPGACP